MSSEVNRCTMSTTHSGLLLLKDLKAARCAESGCHLESEVITTVPVILELEYKPRWDDHPYHAGDGYWELAVEFCQLASLEHLFFSPSRTEKRSCLSGEKRFWNLRTTKFRLKTIRQRKVSKLVRNQWWKPIWTGYWYDPWPSKVSPLVIEHNHRKWPFIVCIPS